jgi:hypothetical protein
VNNAWAWVVTFASKAPPLQAAIPLGDAQLLLSPSGVLRANPDGSLQRVAAGAASVPNFTPGRVAAVGRTMVALAAGGAFSLTLP